MSALSWIIKEAKRLRRKYPNRFREWKQYVAQASAIYASKHKGKSPIGKKRRRKVSAIKIVEAGETRRTYARHVYKQKRSHSGHFKGVRKIASIGSHKSAIRSQLKERMSRALLGKELATNARQHRRFSKQIQELRRDMNRYC
jgi:hypothetical protein